MGNYRKGLLHPALSLSHGGGFAMALVLDTNNETRSRKFSSLAKSVS